MAKPSRPYHLDLQFRGHVEGLTYLDHEAKPLCHFFGGVPYALPPIGPFRFQKPRSLPPCYRYGTKVNPARFTGGCGLCPQPGHSQLDDTDWDEDCLQCNVWIPAGSPPAEGWPVLFYIHGGFLQFGSPNGIDFRALLSSSPVKCIVVAPAYRVNILGFLSSPELLSADPKVSANVGFWDQRLALEWTHQNISYFGGNASNITIAGYSAGSHSVFHQLAYDLGVEDKKSIVKRAVMWSNGPGMQPKSLTESHEQYTQLLSALNIPSTLSPHEKLARLRSLPAKTLLGAIFTIPLHQFRASTDGLFVRENLLQELSNGVLARTMLRRNVHLMTGECSQEHFLYSTWRTPAPGYTHLQHRLEADYPKEACEIVMKHYFPTSNHDLPPQFKDWQDLFGKVYADLQVHALERGMVHELGRHGAGENVHRYRIEWRSACLDDKLPKEWGATHTSDLAIWFYGNGEVLTAEDDAVVRRSFLEPLNAFLNGDVGSMNWGARGVNQIRTLKSTGSVVVEDDTGMEEGLRLWKALKSCGATGSPVRESKL